MLLKNYHKCNHIRINLQNLRLNRIDLLTALVLEIVECYKLDSKISQEVTPFHLKEIVNQKRN